MQLPPYAEMRGAQKVIEHGLLKRMGQRASERLEKRVRLPAQCRMRPAILEFSSKALHGGAVKDAELEVVKSAGKFCKGRHADCPHYRFGPVTLIDARGFAPREKGETRSPMSKSYSNDCEAEIVKNLAIKFAPRHWAEFADGLTVISPCRDQLLKVEEIKNNVKKMAHIGVVASAVCSMQGGQSGVAIMSAARSSKGKVIGFAAEAQWASAGVAIAQAGLVALGDFDCLRKDELWARFEDHCMSEASKSAFCIDIAEATKKQAGIEARKALFPEALTHRRMGCDGHERA
eukprot:Plantae.Rhodophyta-Hildenbrandia_rubra.ctg19978.p1 GENE.Plantae.Rhodophyta-Hildenbrandia_rubra.ctg19978~~Plantae.Rhodophyta-Hildenbrandia_rubra.ctg19978.p1  ORF type:complete len:290 (-),score=48.05 Plantae.Rhodophyta-Hildenbrandia_rubra.ctg19978:582-1451(-)